MTEREDFPEESGSTGGVEEGDGVSDDDLLSPLLGEEGSVAEILGLLSDVDPDAEADAAGPEGADADRAGHDRGAHGVSLDETGLVLPIDYAAPKAQHPEGSGREAVPAADRAALADVEAELNLRWPETKIDPSLDRIRLLMDLLGEPQRAFRTIHVAGTNGKTSTVRMVESLVRAFHRRTGRTTSPHLQSPTERIAIDGVPVSPRTYVDTWREIRAYVEMVDERSEVPMSTFEVLTGMAFAAFADAPVDVGVVEVGLGGRWDATNVVNSDVAVITPVGMDHMDYLGHDLEAIAGEKAGIIKPRPESSGPAESVADQVAVIGRQEPDAMRAILRRAVEVGAQVARLGSEFGVAESRVAVGGQQLVVQGLAGEYPDLWLPLSGPYQADNAAVALAAVEAFFGAGPGRQLDVETVRRGFAAVTSPGRLERMRSTPPTFIDAAHNPQGARALGLALDRDFNFTRLIGVVAALADKDVHGVLCALEPHLTEVVITTNSSPRALSAEELADHAVAIFGDDRVHVAAALPEAYDLAVGLAEEADIQSGSGIVITGSVVTAGEARAMFGKEPA